MVIVGLVDSLGSGIGEFHMTSNVLKAEDSLWQTVIIGGVSRDALSSNRTTLFWLLVVLLYASASQSRLLSL
jgi:hypothetical protein